MVIVAGGSSSRFGSDKLLAEIDGRPLLQHTIDAIAPHVDQVVLAARADLVGRFQGTDLIVVEGGATRTESESNGLRATPPAELIGIHDGARPAIRGDLIEGLFAAARTDGGAVPGLDPDGLGVDNEFVHPTQGAFRVQTPQVFWGPELKAAYAAAERNGYTGPDTMAVVHQFTNLNVLVVPGDPENLKVTHPADLEKIRRILGRSSSSS